MNIARTLACAAFALAGFPLLAQTSTPEQQSAAPAAQQPAESNPSATSAPPAATLSSVKGELVDKLDTKTAKTGDPVVIKTRSNLKTTNGTEIPKGSKLVGRVTAVRPVGDGNPNSQVALQFDRAELKSGQSLPIHAELQELSSSDSASPDATAASPGPSPSTSAAPVGGSGTMNGSTAATTTQTPAPTSTPQMGSSAPSGPAAGTVVARTGNIAIRTTSIPGVLLANNEPGQHDPRMAQSSGILLGPRHDIHLDGGTHVVVGVAVTSAANPGGE